MVTRIEIPFYLTDGQVNSNVFTDGHLNSTPCDHCGQLGGMSFGIPSVAIFGNRKFRGDNFELVN